MAATMLSAVRPVAAARMRVAPKQSRAAAPMRAQRNAVVLRSAATDSIITAMKSLTVRRCASRLPGALRRCRSLRRLRRVAARCAAGSRRGWPAARPDQGFGARGRRCRASAPFRAARLCLRHGPWTALGGPGAESPQSRRLLCCTLCACGAPRTPPHPLWPRRARSRIPLPLFLTASLPSAAAGGCRAGQANRGDLRR